MEKRIKRINVETDFDPYVFQPKEKLKDIIHALTNTLNNVPDEHKSDVIFNMYYDQYDNFFEFELYYTREETDEEYMARVRKSQRQAIQRESNERQQYEALKKKYG